MRTGLVDGDAAAREPDRIPRGVNPGGVLRVQLVHAPFASVEQPDDDDGPEESLESEASLGSLGSDAPELSDEPELLDPPDEPLLAAAVLSVVKEGAA